MRRHKSPPRSFTETSDEQPLDYRNAEPRQAAAIQRWKPWEKSTGPRTAEGKAIVARNAFKGGKRPLLRAKLREIREALKVLDLYDRL